MRRHRLVISKANGSLIALSLFMLAPPASAYLDPSTGSMILSAIVGLIATVALAVKTYWYKLKSWFRRDAESEAVPLDEQATEPETSADR